MIIKKILLISLITSFFNPNAYSWNSLGHRLVAQIAWDHLTPQAQQRFSHYNQAVDKHTKSHHLINAATWLDSQRRPDQQYLIAKHYINLPYTLDGSPLLKPHANNAVTAVSQAMSYIQSNNKSDFDKGVSLRILLHVVADLHQPMHTISQFSQRFPTGDKGGNLYYLGRNPIAKNLHTYWDMGGGFLKSNKSYSLKQLASKARYLEKLKPCELANMNLDISIWMTESHQLAKQYAYQIKLGEKPTKHYQRMTKQISQERLALAGCRLAALLNQLAVIN